MSAYTSFVSGGGGGANLNLNNAEEALGFATDGTTTLVTAGGSNNTKGTYVSFGTSANDWAGFWLYLGQGSASAGRYILDVRQGGATVIVPDLYVEPGQSLAPVLYWIPMAVTAGLIEVRCQAENSSRTIRVGIVGIIRNSQSAPMYTTMTALNVDTTNTRASATDIVMQNSAGTTYGTLSASLPSTAGGFLFVPGGTGTSPATSQQTGFQFATGAAASEVPFAWHSTWISNAAASFSNRAPKFIEHTVASGARISVKPTVATPGTDAMRCAAYAFT